jgi:peptidoglycan/LPS O-acetylase OafA/YrhL
MRPHWSLAEVDAGSSVNERRSVLEGRIGGETAPSGESIVPKGGMYLPSLDGIRAISFFLVFFAHAGLGKVLVPGGFGVTIFFLLSGFLITTLLRMEYQRHGRISLKDFYLRRALRILPPLYVTLALSMLLVTIGGVTTGIPLWATLSQALQYANYYEIYAANPVSMPGTGVFWSLAVEEHFYLLFPLFYVWMCARFTPARQASVLLILCAVALAWRCLLFFHFQSSFDRIYLATDTRFDSILLGCVLAIAASPVLRDPLYQWSVSQMRWLVPLSLALLVGTFLYRDEGFRNTFRYTIQGVALMPLLLAAIHFQGSLVVRILNLAWVRFLGVLSYSLYLCHSIILEALIKVWAAGPVFTAAMGIAGALIFATLVHYCVERPCTKARKRLSRVHSN